MPLAQDQHFENHWSIGGKKHIRETLIHFANYALNMLGTVLGTEDTLANKTKSLHSSLPPLDIKIY